MSIFGFFALIAGACAFLAVVWAVFFAEDGDPVKNSVFRIGNFLMKCSKRILHDVACFFLEAGEPAKTGTKKPHKRRSAHPFLRLLPRPKGKYKYKTYLTGDGRIRKKI